MAENTIVQQPNESPGRLITIPELSFVVLIGASGSGKSSFAARHFAKFESLSSDFCRGLVSNDENSQAASVPAFETLHFIAAKRLEAGLLTVVDATNVQAEARKPLVELARRYHVLPIAIVLDLPEHVCRERNRTRPDRTFGPHVIRQQRSQLHRSLRNLQREGFRQVHILRSPEEIDAVRIIREPLWNNRRTDHGPFDIIGDVHGCADELVELLRTLGYVERQGVWSHPSGRKAVFLGDLVDRGPRVPDVLQLVMRMVAAGHALAVPGNHDMKLMRKLRGRDVQITHGLQESLTQLDIESAEFRERVANFLDDLVSHYVLDDGSLVVAHAGLKAEMQGRGSGKVRDFALYGETTGETDEFGLPIRYNWAAEYRGQAMVVYGHTPVPEPEWLNGTINIDTGCVFGGRLTALRYPERELVSVAARQVYAEPSRPFAAVDTPSAALSAQQQLDDVLDLADVTGKRIVNTRLHHNVTIREENGIAALEVMSRFAVNPKWLMYLPPTMSPSETSKRPDYLEHPMEAFEYFRLNGTPKVVCEEKHMGSRAVIVVCRDEEAARRRFGVMDEGNGMIYTRTGRRFFDDPVMERELLGILTRALDRSDFWSRQRTDWVCLDCELMPWSAKAQELIRRQYAPVAAAARLSIAAVNAVLAEALARGAVESEIVSHYRERERLAVLYEQAYERYAWPVDRVSDLRLAPFHILATESAVHVDKDHEWHMQAIAALCGPDLGEGVLMATSYRMIDVTDAESQAAGTAWWEELTERGGEGMVVKPLPFIARGRRGLLQPAVKCRGREYLRIIYGPEYSLPANLDRLRSRGLGHKRSLALREFALGVEALERFVRREPLRRVHECVFGVLALESEPVDPRL